MGVRTWISDWPVYRQLTGTDPLGRGAAAKSRISSGLAPRTATSDKVVKSVCPYCAVGCGQDVYVKDGKVVQIEGDPDSPISRGRLCPKGRPRRSPPSRQPFSAAGDEHLRCQPGRPARRAAGPRGGDRRGHRRRAGPAQAARQRRRG